MSTQESPPSTDCPNCARLQRELDAALTWIAVLEAQLKELIEQLKRNSSNSSTPPSAYPLNAPKPVVKLLTGRHRGHHRVRLPQSRVNVVIPYVPQICSGCHGPLPSAPGPNDHEVAWHQGAELPVMAAIVTKYQAHSRACPGCGLVNCGTIPAEIRDHVLGPRVAATMSYLSDRFHLSKRPVKEFVEAVFEVPVSLGTVANLEQQTCAALISAHDQARHAVREAPVKNDGEIGWKQAGAKRWLWTAATTTVAFFVIHVHRGSRGLKALRGETITGIIISDHWEGYNRLPLEQRRVC